MVYSIIVCTKVVTSSFVVYQRLAYTCVHTALHIK